MSDRAKKAAEEFVATVFPSMDSACALRYVEQGTKILDKHFPSDDLLEAANGMLEEASTLLWEHHELRRIKEEALDKTGSCKICRKSNMNRKDPGLPGNGGGSNIAMNRAKKAAEELYVISTLGDGAGSWIVPESKLKDELHKAYCSCGAESWQECQTNGVVDYVAAIDDEDNWTHDFPDYKRHVFEDRGEDYTLRVIRLDESKHFPSDDLLEAEKALGVIAVALAEPAGGEYWSARKLADEWGIYNDDLDGDRVLLRIAEKALGRLRAAIAGKEGGQ